jgi:hypothetical protein
MRTYTINFPRGGMAEEYGIRTPEKQAQRTQLWLLGMSEALAVVAPQVTLKVITGSVWWIQFSCDSEELVNMIQNRLEGYGAILSEPYQTAV